MRSILLPIPGLDVVLLRELERRGVRILEERDELILVEGDGAGLNWVQCVWPGVEEIPIESIGDGARKLRERGRNWALCSSAHHRRAQLIQDKLPHYPRKPLPFLAERPTLPMGGWTLWEPGLILAAPQTSSPYPLGAMEFQEDHHAPPSRAYLKLWEFFTCHGPRPAAGERVIDLGSSPGGWTWVLQGLGCHVVSVDKAPLDPGIAALPRVEYIGESAFGLAPESVGPVDWLFSDIICYPERLLNLIERWRASGLARNYLCTIKFQGSIDLEAVDKFAEIPGSRLLHQHHNKHELTWWLAAS
jgi:23S rRNA (cytidine2498-2'-O)-methyltransferase